MLLLAAALLIAMSAGAQLKSSSARMPVAQMKEMKMGAPGMPAHPRLNANRDVKPYYIRPAGAFAGTFMYETSDPTYVSWYTYKPLFLACKPYTDYTFRSVSDGVGADAIFSWLIISPDYNEQVYGRDYTTRYGVSTASDTYYVPEFGIRSAPN